MERCYKDVCGWHICSSPARPCHKAEVSDRAIRARISADSASAQTTCSSARSRAFERLSLVLSRPVATILPSHTAVRLSRALAGGKVPHFDSLACCSVASALAQRCAHHTLTPSHHHLTTLSLSPSPRLLPRPSPYSRPTYDPPGPDLSTISRAGDVAGLISHLHFTLYALVAALWGPVDGNGTGISIEVCSARARAHT